MATSNRDRISQSLDVVAASLRPFVDREMRALEGNDWLQSSSELFNPRDHSRIKKEGVNALDVQALMDVLMKRWHVAFSKSMGHEERSAVSQIKTARNDWAHQKAFDMRATLRALDAMQVLLEGVGDPKAAQKIAAHYEAVQFARLEQQAKSRSERAVKAATEGKPMGGLKPWRELIEPHPDVQKGEYGKSEFAVDLNQVHHSLATREYSDPALFFQRTFLTEGLKRLLVSGIKRLAGNGGDPVIQLQTNFGGGKTHSMLAMYHAVSGKKAAELPGMESVIKAAGVEDLPEAKRAVFVGTAHGTSEIEEPDKGVRLHTIWGRLAYQLSGKEGYNLIRESDEKGTAPGSNQLRKIFDLAGTSLILIDEWVAFVRHAYVHDDLPCGTFDANLTFAQNLTEAVKSHPTTLLLASLPESNIEAGGQGGAEALVRLQNTFGRIESNWTPATTEETFRIVRQRLFQPMSPDAIRDRDAIIKAFMTEYSTNNSEYPGAVQQMEYRDRMMAAYPIHPELFDRLYEDWGTQPRFQRTRGVLRFMASVIRELWIRDDRNLLILPGTIPFDEQDVYGDLLRHSEERGWASILEADVDGTNAKALGLDREVAHLGKLSAARRVGRTVFLPSPATHTGSKKGLDKKQIMLGCVQPGEQPSTFGDALRRLTEVSSYLYNDRSRYWYSLNPSAARIAQDIAADMDNDHVDDFMRSWLKDQFRGRTSRWEKGSFPRLHICPPGPADVGDDDARTGLVVLGPETPHSKNTESAGLKWAKRILDERGSASRNYRNTLLFLAPDEANLESLRDSARMFEAWQDVLARKDALNLDKLQTDQALDQQKRSKTTFESRLLETYKWLLAPRQDLPEQGKAAPPVEWDEIPIRGGTEFIRRVADKSNGEVYYTTLQGHTLRHYIDKVPLWRGENKDHVALDQLAEDFSKYLYLPRLADSDVLVRGIMTCTQLLDSAGAVAIADGVDGDGRFLNLRIRDHKGLGLKSGTIIVHPVAAETQRAAEEPITNERWPPADRGQPGTGDPVHRITLDGTPTRAIGRIVEAARERDIPLGFIQKQVSNVDNLDETACSRLVVDLQEMFSSHGHAAMIKEGDFHIWNTKSVPSESQAAVIKRFYLDTTLDPLTPTDQLRALQKNVLQHLAGAGGKAKIRLIVDVDLPDGADESLQRTVKENCNALKVEEAGFVE